jgi:hypothetical protein
MVNDLLVITTIIKKFKNENHQYHQQKGFGGKRDPNPKIWILEVDSDWCQESDQQDEFVERENVKEQEYQQYWGKKPIILILYDEVAV